MIPKVEDLCSTPMVHKQGDVFNPPGLTNFLGTVQTDIDLTGIMNLNFPPFSCGNPRTASLYINGVYFASTGVKITTTWYPDKIIRTVDYDGLTLTSTTVLKPADMAVLVKISVKNLSSYFRDVKLRLGLHGSVVRKDSAWTDASIPCDSNNLQQIEQDIGAVIYESSDSNAFMVQGVSPAPEKIDDRGITVNISVESGQEESVFFCAALGRCKDIAVDLFQETVSGGESVIRDARELWNDELRAVFTPDNDRYSGHLPELITKDQDILRLYYMGILGVIYFRRDNPNSVYGRAYDTLMPAYWQTVTFLWDYSLSSLVHSLLDPKVMRRYMTNWMSTDIHNHFGTEYLTGGPVGPWYSVNDYAMSRMANDYLRWTGDKEWLDRDFPENSNGQPKTVLEYLEFYALYWKEIAGEDGLADYGGLNNLLECVGSYLHKVASLNAGNVFSMRALAEIMEQRGSTNGEQLRQEAEKLLTAIQKLYADGEGFWNTRFPSGDLVEVRHCYDFITILHTIADDLTDKQKNEMFKFFTEELQSETWLRALSPKDPDAPFSLRPDHQWNGAYPAWPAQAVTGLYALGRTEEAFAWLKGLAKSANQGPFGQAHFTDDFIGTENGGAPKASSEMPYICDWTVSAGGSWVNIIIESIFGVKASLAGEISAKPNFGAFDPEAKLVNLSFQGELYTVDAGGLTMQGAQNEL